MKNTIEQFLGGITPENFLQNYWQKKPLFVKRAFSNVDHLATPQDLLEMAQNENFETRMVTMAREEIPWDAMLGPFTKNQFPRNEKDKWTLIVHNLELYFKEFRQIKDMLNFIPTWQFDDIMSTYSVKGSSVGAHIDNYNVFIFQGMGKRHWQINENPDETYIENLPIKLLSNFKANQEFILEPGDLLYLPPGVAHHGISLEESISYSIGYKSFDHTNMVSSFFGEFISIYNSSKCLKSHEKSVPENINEVREEHIDDVMNFFLKDVVTRDNVKKWFGKYITAPRDEIICEEVLSTKEITANLKASRPLYRDEFLRFNFIKEADDIKLIANEHEYLISKEDYNSLEILLDTPSCDVIKMPKDISESILKVIVSLINQGALFFQ